MWVGGEAHEFRARVPRVWAREGAAAAAAGSVVTPMPGRVIKARAAAAIMPRKRADLLRVFSWPEARGDTWHASSPHCATKAQQPL